MQVAGEPWKTKLLVSLVRLAVELLRLDLLAWLVQLTAGLLRVEPLV